MRRFRILLAAIVPPATFVVMALMTISARPFTPHTFEHAGVSDTLDDPSIMEIWNGECKACHGPDGKGQTKAGRRAGSKDFTDPEYQKSWTDSEALQVVKTATKDGKKLKNKDPYGEQFSDEQIKALISYVREFAKGS